MSSTPTGSPETSGFDMSPDTPLLRIPHVGYTNPVAPQILAAMRDAGFIMRRRRGVKDALWMPGGYWGYTPCRVGMLRYWITRSFRIWDESRQRFIPAHHQMASWVTTVIRADDSHGLPIVTDEIIGLITEAQR